jgi:hypothetical protein
VIEIHTGTETDTFALKLNNLRDVNKTRITGMYGVFVEEKATGVSPRDYGGSYYQLCRADLERLFIAKFFEYNKECDIYHKGESVGGVTYTGDSISISIQHSTPASDLFYFTVWVSPLERIRVTMPKQHVELSLGRVSTAKEDYEIILKFDSTPAPVASTAFTELLSNVTYDNIQLILKDKEKDISIVHDIQNNTLLSYLLCTTALDRKCSIFGAKGNLFLALSVEEFEESSFLFLNVLKEKLEQVIYTPLTSYADIVGTVKDGKTYLFSAAFDENWDVYVDVFCVEDNTHEQAIGLDGDGCEVFWCGTLNGYLTFVTNSMVGVKLEAGWVTKSFNAYGYVEDIGTISHFKNANFLAVLGGLEEETGEWNSYYMKLFVNIEDGGQDISIEFQKNQSTEELQWCRGIYDESCFVVPRY